MDIDAPLARLPDWRPRLATYLGQVARRKFRPGRHDCALFAAGAVRAMTGQDLAAAWRGKYRTLEAGQAALQAAGFSDHVALAASFFAAIDPARAQVGDLAVLPADGPEARGALGIIQGPLVYVLTPGGLALVSRLEIERAFKI